MKKRTKIFFRLLVSYLIAATVLWAYMLGPHHKYNAHAPFSGYPDVLLLSPGAPFFMLEANDIKTTIIQVIIFIGVFLLVFFFLSKTKKPKA